MERLGKPRHRRGRPKAERTGSERIKSLATVFLKIRVVSTSLDMTMLDNSKPRRQLGLFDATMIVMGGIVGAGIFANPSEVAHRVHTPFLILGVWVQIGRAHV